MGNLLDYYSRKDIQKAIVVAAKDREVAVKFADKGFGKRPDILQFENDVYEFAKQGATSFHISEEHWTNPQLLKAGMIKNELDKVRKGWDLILDIDGPLEYSKITANLIIEALKFHDIENISCKFSGNRGFHIAIPFTSFPKKVKGQVTKLLFPEGPKVIASYLKEMIKDPLKEEILKKDLSKDKDLNPFSILDIDTNLISNRHMFRSPYSYHEKSGLVSIPINHDKVLGFRKEDAKLENVNTNIKFLNDDTTNEGEASILILQALDWDIKNKKKEPIKVSKSKSYQTPKVAISEKFFPPCIKLLVNGVKEDGRKRGLFILINFLKGVGYNYEQMEEFLLKWNQNNYRPLRENYIKTQLSYNKNKNQTIPPQNCPHASKGENVYTQLGICHPDNFCKLIKNPLQYAKRKSRVFGKKK